jgi:hypothetical protein
MVNRFLAGNRFFYSPSLTLPEGEGTRLTVIVLIVKPTPAFSHPSGRGGIFDNTEIHGASAEIHGEKESIALV